MKRKNPIYAYKRLLANDHDWDYGYLIALEKKKLQRMYHYMKHGKALHLYHLIRAYKLLTWWD